MQRQSFDADLKQLRQTLVDMTERVQRSIVHAVEALRQNNVVMAESVIAEDHMLNEYEAKIADIGSTLIALQQPVATDLRRILAAFKMASDLERMGDLAVDIAKTVRRMQGEALIKPLIDIPRMSDIVLTMLRECVQAFVEEDVQRAVVMAQLDDEVDHLHSQILRELFTYVMENPRNVNQALLLCFVSRYLERMADHVTNIGENIVYAVEGRRPDLNV
jgi:phosphate transport system protein